MQSWWYYIVYYKTENKVLHSCNSSSLLIFFENTHKRYYNYTFQSVILIYINILIKLFILIWNTKCIYEKKNTFGITKKLNNFWN